MDAVLTWVDGSDPAFRARMAPYLTRQHEDRRTDVAGRARLISSREIFLAVASLLRFAPYIGRIWIVTNGQDPVLGPFLDRYFPDSRVEVKVIDQSVLFEGYESCLPVFNSMSVETMLWRIPGLSEDFLYMNDDYFLTAPTTLSDVQGEGGRSVCYAVERPVAWADFLRKFHPVRDGHRRISFKDTLANGSKVLGDRKYFHLSHAPEAMKRSVFARYFAEHPDVMLKNAAHRFRSEGQFNVQNFYYRLALREGLAECRSPRGVFIMLRPLRHKRRYMERKLARIARMPGLKFCCMNSLQDAREEDARLFWAWVSSLLDIDFTIALQNE